MHTFRGMREASLDEVLRHLREEVSSAGAVRVGERLEGVRVRPEHLGPFLHFRRGRYTRNLVYRDPGFEVVLNCWDTGAVSPIHDHDGQECWFSIQAGTFMLEDFPLLSGGREPGPAVLGPPRIADMVGPGHVDHRSPQDSIHRVSALIGPAVTLHVYAAPVERCLVFDARRQRCTWRMLSYHSIFGRPVQESSWGETTDRR
ncbi:cysteine dioxygenase [Hyalangium rubrum]|uniref:Cysteine dioxygenase family protein n=1 Tax=Hyalangium rubrum TaxID=3103134 RepID=A0ABU5HCQ6_9BACT|nr:cysteine dioxygenase family protein [Hyalangium sp. s54d21]MDY7231244.1 cysteine dioxygenase family protein [Hyalangium sp. s54d21]